jgi:hypothetical protein
MPLEPAAVFYPRYAWQILARYTRVAWDLYKLDRMRRRILNDPRRKDYFDPALAPVHEDETEVLELFTHNASARNEVVRTRKIAELTRGGAAQPAAL